MIPVVIIGIIIPVIVPVPVVIAIIPPVPWEQVYDNRTIPCTIIVRIVSPVICTTVIRIIPDVVVTVSV